MPVPIKPLPQQVQPMDWSTTPIAYLAQLPGSEFSLLEITQLKFHGFDFVGDVFAAMLEKRNWLDQLDGTQKCDLSVAAGSEALGNKLERIATSASLPNKPAAFLERFDVSVEGSVDPVVVEVKEAAKAEEPTPAKTLGFWRTLGANVKAIFDPSGAKAIVNS